MSNLVKIYQENQYDDDDYIITGISKHGQKLPNCMFSGGEIVKLIEQETCQATVGCSNCECNHVLSYYKSKDSNKKGLSCYYNVRKAK